MARTKKSNKKNDETTKIIRNYDPMSLEKRLYDLDHAPQRSWDLYSIEKRIYDLEMGGAPGPSPSGSYTIELGTPIEGASVTLESGKYYIFTTVYNTGSFTNASVVFGKIGSVYIQDAIGRMICIVKTLSTNVSYSGSGPVAPNKYVPITIKKNGVDITAYVFGDPDFMNDDNIDATVNGIYMVASSNLSDEFTGAEVIGSFTMDISSTYADTKIYVIKATDENVTYGSNSFYYNRIVGGDIFA